MTISADSSIAAVVGELRLDPRTRELLKAIPGMKSTVRLARGIRNIRRQYTLYRWETDVPLEARERLVRSGLAISIADKQELRDLEQIETWRPAAAYRLWHEQGRELMLGKLGGEIVTYTWLDHARECFVEQVPEIRFRLDAAATYSDEAYTPARHRGRGLRQLMFIAELMRARELSYRYIVSYFLDSEKARNGLRNFERIGIPRGTPLKVVTETRLFGLRHTSLADVTRDTTIEVILK